MSKMLKSRQGERREGRRVGEKRKVLGVPVAPERENRVWKTRRERRNTMERESGMESVCGVAGDQQAIYDRFQPIRTTYHACSSRDPMPLWQDRARAVKRGSTD